MKIKVVDTADQKFLSYPEEDCWKFTTEAIFSTQLKENSTTVLKRTVIEYSSMYKSSQYFRQATILKRIAITENKGLRYSRSEISQLS